MKYWLLKPDPEFRVLDWFCDFPWVSDDRLVDEWSTDRAENAPQPGDIIFVWNSGNLETAGIVAEGKIVCLPEESSILKHKVNYFQTAKPNSTGMIRIALKYVRFCAGNPVSKKELGSQEYGGALIPIIDSQSQLVEIPGKEGKAIGWMMVGRTTFIDLTYCQT